MSSPEKTHENSRSRRALLWKVLLVLVLFAIGAMLVEWSDRDLLVAVRHFLKNLIRQLF
jgi:hypothetical protein